MTYLLLIIGLAQLALAWVVIDYLRRILDVLRLLAAQGSQRRQWVKQEHET